MQWCGSAAKILCIIKCQMAGCTDSSMNFCRHRTDCPGLEFSHGSQGSALLQTMASCAGAIQMWRAFSRTARLVTPHLVYSSSCIGSAADGFLAASGLSSTSCRLSAAAARTF
mmetsp:Transcript_14270/g.43842  ORF Transcript_14270/g.43842 Transcript_14270/m.43842 type:complete len:113 (-) Transcript_14270:561-899(-)